MKRVLLVEEDPAIQSVLVTFLQNWADSVHATHRLCEGLQHFSEGNSYDVIVCDSQFFTSDAQQVLQTLKEQRLDGIPWLLTTELKEPLPSGWVVYSLPRPFLPGELHRHLDFILQ